MGRGRRRTGKYLQERGKGERQISVEIEVKWDEGRKKGSRLKEKARKAV